MASRNVADIMVGSFYDETLDEGCAFEELISFHGGLGGPQTRPFILAPPSLALPTEPLIGAAAVHGLLRGWRLALVGLADDQHRALGAAQEPVGGRAEQARLDASQAA